MSFKKLTISTAVILALSACGGSDNKVVVETPVPVVPDPVVPDAPSINLEEIMPHISTSEPLKFIVDLPEDAETLVINLFSGDAGEPLGDPDLYVRFEAEASAGENGEFDCFSFKSDGDNEACIIDKPLAGRYHILIDAFEGGTVTDASLYVSTEIFKGNKLCTDVAVRIRAQEMTEEELTQVCDDLTQAKAQFNTVLDDTITPEFSLPVEGDLNEVTNLHIFSSLSNHVAWGEHLFNLDNDSGIYLESEATKWSHRSDIITFNGLEWTDGFPVIRSLQHEYIHALDARFNKEGNYISANGWWSEGLAEYTSTFYNSPYRLVAVANEAEKFTLSEVFDHTASKYSWGQLAIAFFIEEHPELVNGMLVKMRAGEWDAFQEELLFQAQTYQDEFVTWYSGESLTQQFNNSVQSLALDDYQAINGRGGWLYSVEVAEGADSLTIATKQGANDVDLWINYDSAVHPSLDDTFTCSSETDGNDESCTIDNPAAGTYYVTVGAYRHYSDIVGAYLTACIGADCSVDVPEEMQTIEIKEPHLPHWPSKGGIGSCTLAEPNYSTDTPAIAVAITNTTDSPVGINWLRSDGESWDGPYEMLEKGDTWQSTYWKEGDRVVLTDAAENCLGIALLNDEDNRFEIDEELVKDAVNEVQLPEQATAIMGSCDLAVPYDRDSSTDAPEFQVVNTSATKVDLQWISNTTGEATSSVYATLDADNPIFKADNWVVTDRMMIVDQSSGDCIGVLDLNETSNIFILDL
ncbi:collagenase [Colwellia psychrerythraea]|uniref:Peptidase M9A collagenase n=1 Tax=Colwellia psychrerythraea TaxID=28229 RepID=A0A099KLU7_COLPS|nr:collagenase [Colwellia psychrerythraea]KGJ91200.1 peptidase M9A collagenase [Colwellia psychrerythraea]